MDYKKCAALLLLVFSLSSCGSQQKQPSSTSEGSDSRPTHELQFIEKFNGSSVCLEDERLDTFVNADDENTQAMMLYNNKPVGKPSFKNENLFYTSWFGGEAPYIVQVSDNQSFSNNIYDKTTYTHSLEMVGSRFVPNTSYFIKITDSKGNVINDNFVTKETPIIYDLDGIFNVRDLGGWKLNGGTSKIKNGLLIRGANIDFINDASKRKFNEEMGIKTDLDLRGALESEKDQMDSMTSSPSGCEKFLNVRINVYDDITKYPQIQDPLYKQIFEYLAEPSNYPIYFHCAQGADRTGTLAFLIEALLGANYFDMLKEYELTSFYYTSARWRYDISVDSSDPIKTKYSFKRGQYYNSDSRIMDLVSGLYNKWADPIEDSSLSMDEKYALTINDAVEKYLRNGLGISDTQIDSIRSILSV